MSKGKVKLMNNEEINTILKDKDTSKVMIALITLNAENTYLNKAIGDKDKEIERLIKLYGDNE